MAKNISTSTVKTVQKFLERFAPWKVAGPLTSSEWKSADLDVSEYRLQAPADHPVPPRIPRTTPDKVYDIRYFVRDTRRDHFVVGGTNKKFQEKVMFDPTTAQAENVCMSPPNISSFRDFNCTRRPLLEYDGDGYQ